MYSYAALKPNVFTEDGQAMFLAIRDKAMGLLEEAGAVQMGRLLCVTGDTWSMMACVDRMVELGELREVENPHSGAGQHRIFVAGKS